MAGSSYAAESTNWSGQYSNGTTFSSVAGDWVVPAVQPTTTSEASGTWIGVDGGPDSPDTILQTGTGQETEDGATSYYAWYEVFPNPAVVLGAVSPGDQMEAAISYSSGSTWDLSIADLTSGNSASGPLTYSGPGDSAEWIEEVPEAASPPQPYLANFGTAEFTEISATAADPSAAAVAPIDMVDPVGNIIAETGPISSSAFTVTYVHEPTTTSIAANPSASSAGSSVTYSATVRSPGPPPTGSVTFTDGSTTLCTASISGGSGSCAATNTPLGGSTVEGQYSGDANSKGSSGTTPVSVVEPPPTAIGWSAPTVGFSRSARRSSTARPAACVCSDQWSASCPRRPQRLLARRVRWRRLLLRRHAVLRVHPRARYPPVRVGPPEQLGRADRWHGALG